LWKLAGSFPEQCRYVLESLGEIYGYDAEARRARSEPRGTAQISSENSGPVMNKLHQWLEGQFTERKTEPNSGLGKAITYLLRHWKALTLFLRQEESADHYGGQNRGFKTKWFLNPCPRTW
jgi:hypothetical protein